VGVRFPRLIVPWLIAPGLIVSWPIAPYTPKPALTSANLEDVLIAECSAAIGLAAGLVGSRPTSSAELPVIGMELAKSKT